LEFAAFSLVFSIVVQIDRVTRASGRIVTQQTKQEVQHLEGGIIAEILVKQGDTVVAGQPLMRVENSFFKSELAQAAIELGPSGPGSPSGRRNVRRQRDQIPAGSCGGEPASRRNEISLFRRRQANLNEQLSILAQQQRQKEIELSELRSRQPSVTRERQISEERLSSLHKLSSIGAASNNERLEAERVCSKPFLACPIWHTKFHEPKPHCGNRATQGRGCLAVSGRCGKGARADGNRPREADEEY
jgi:multidrug efflux pump subunit AcrA (membrane-fusion protein)